MKIRQAVNRTLKDKEKSYRHNKIRKLEENSNFKNIKVLFKEEVNGYSLEI